MKSTHQAGRLLGEGKYELLSPIGGGAMGAVWLARHVALERMVAVKLLAPTSSGTRAQGFDAAERFLREARTASLLRHRNTVQLLDYGVDGEDHWLVMEYLEGRNLADELDEEGRLAPARAIAIASQVLAAVAEAHDYGVVHRDLKPSNVMLVPWVDDDGREGELAKVVDFGIATLFRDPVTGEVAGTPEYMSPEQAQGLELDPRSDVYSVAVVLHHMVVGDVPFRGPTPFDVMLAHVNATPRAPRTLNPAISERLEQVLLQAMAKTPAERYPNARAFRSALLALPEAQGLKPDSAPELPPVSAVSTAPAGLASAKVVEAASGRRQRRWVVPVLAVALLGGAIAVLAWGLGQRSESSPGAPGASRDDGDLARSEAQVGAATPAPVEPAAVRVEPDVSVAKVAPDTVANIAPDSVANIAPDTVAIAPDSVANIAPDTVANIAPDTVAKAAPSEPDASVARVEPDAAARLEAKRQADAKARLEAARKVAGDGLKPPEVAASAARDPIKDVAPPEAVVPKVDAVVPKVEPVAPKVETVVPKVEPVAPRPIPALAARAAVTQLAVRGSLPRSSVQRALDAVTPALAECYRRWAEGAGHDQAATGTVSLGIDVDGGATRVAVGSWPMAGIAPCLTQAIARARTRDRPDTGTVEATFSLVFAPLPPKGP